MESRLRKIHEMKTGKWILGFALAGGLKADPLAKTFITDEKFLGSPYLIDYKEPDTMLIATNPLED